MKRRMYFWLPVLLVAVAISLASCGGSAGSAGSGSAGEDGTRSAERETSDGGESSQQEGTGGMMAGMDHDQMGHGSMGMGSGNMAQQMLMENGKYSDERFIDAMVPHHQGAIEMAEVALKNAEHDEIKELSRNIISSQQAEIEQLKSIKKEEFGTSNVPMEMSQEQMRAMGMMMDPQNLANKEPFDKAFIGAMIPHHQAAIEMAEVALEKSENPRIEELAENIISAQQAEIAQIKQWRREWYQ